MLHNWLKAPHVRQWWGDPDYELELIRTGRSSGEADGYVVSVDHAPAGYIQSWLPARHVEEEPWLKYLSPDAIGIDIFIGTNDATGKGFGPLILRAFAQKLCDEGARCLAVDPDSDNTRAISAYRKAGFKIEMEWRDDETSGDGTEAFGGRQDPGGATLMIMTKGQ